MTDDDQNIPKEVTLELIQEAVVPQETAVDVEKLQERSMIGESGLFAPGDDGIAEQAARLTIAESFLKLLTRDLLFQDFVREILLLIIKVVPSEAGSILEVDYLHNHLFFRSVVGQSSEGLTKFTIPMGQGIVGYVAESKQALVVADIEDNKLHLKAIAKTVGFDTRNLVAVPIVIRGKTFGVIELLNRMGEANYSPADLDVLHYACDMAARAIEIRFMLAWAGQAKALTSEKTPISSFQDPDGQEGSAA